ncbi:hypothetical protein [Ferruginibacter sp.]|uniref:hypothetical protein n=1 Tax=Ferruginibacter sp. TaxID=1940288 RepID=UPI0026594628|nr:hypothetical protein [Ferruginibacter sp.]
MKSKVCLLLLTVVAFAACKKNSDIMAPVVTKIDTLSNSITTDMTLDANTSYVINGQLYVTNNATLTIPAGVTVSFVKMDEKEKKGVLVITQGAKLIANGTADKPIVFTSAAGTKAPGDWGAVILLGKAPTNTVTGNVEGLPLSDNTRYGGTTADDNSGSLKYVRLEYCGGINPDEEGEWQVDKASGLCMASVGSGTTVDNVMTVHSNDDAFQFVGGTVNATHLIGFNNGDDDFDFDLGYQGKLQFLISYRSGLSSSHSQRANGFESYNDEFPTTNAPLTRPVVANMTIIGPAGTETAKTSLNQGVYIRKGTRFVVENSIIAEYPQGGLMVCNRTRPVLLTGIESFFKYNLVNSDSASRTFSWDKDFAVVGDPELQQFALNSVNNNVLITNSADLKLKTMYGGVPDLTPDAGSPALTGANFNDADFSSFFTKVAYRGAIGADNWAAANNWAVWK